MDSEQSIEKLKRSMNEVMDFIALKMEENNTDPDIEKYDSIHFDFIANLCINLLAKSFLSVNYLGDNRQIYYKQVREMMTHIANDVLKGIKAHDNAEKAKRRLQ